MQPQTARLVLRWALLALLCQQQASGLEPEPRIDESSKYSLNKQFGSQNSEAETGNFHASGQRAQPSSANTTEQATYYELYNDQDADEEEARITLAEPYKSIFQTTTRFFVAQTSVTNYVNVDTFMDVLSDAGYALSKPSILIRSLKALAILVASIMAGAFFIPYWSLKEAADAALNRPEQLLKLERYLPNGLNEMKVISLLNEKTEELLARFGLNDSTCREQSVCQAGELIRCTFPRVSKISINFISENFSRPKYRGHRYLNAFLTGFIDQNCAISVSSEEQQAGGGGSKSCASNFIKSLASCPRATKSGGGPQAKNQSIFQTIRVVERRAR